MSEEESDTVYEVSMFVSIPLAATGVLLNSLSVAVYVQPAMRSACSSYLVALGLAQVLYLLTMATCPLTRELLLRSWGKTYAFQFLNIYVPALFNAVLRRIAFTLTLVVSIERCLVVTFPLRSSQLRVRRNPVVISCAVYFLVLACHAMVPFKYSILPNDSGTFVMTLTAWWRENSEVLRAVEASLRVLLVYLPLLGTLLCNVVTVLALRHHRRKRLKLQEGWQQTQEQQQQRQKQQGQKQKQHQRGQRNHQQHQQEQQHEQQQRQRQYQNKQQQHHDHHQQRDADSSTTGRRTEVQRTVAILVSTLVFVLLSLPIPLLALLKNYHPQLGYRKQEFYLYLALTQVFALLEVVSNVCDFPVYMALSTRFRVTFQSLFCRRCGKKKPGSEVSDSV